MVLGFHKYSQTSWQKYSTVHAFILFIYCKICCKSYIQVIGKEKEYFIILDCSKESLTISTIRLVCNASKKAQKGVQVNRCIASLLVHGRRKRNVNSTVWKFQNMFQCKPQKGWALFPWILQGGAENVFHAHLKQPRTTQLFLVLPDLHS